MLLKLLTLSKYIFRYKFRFIFMIVVGICYGLVNTSMAGVAGFMVKLINPNVPVDNAISLLPKPIANSEIFQSLHQAYPFIISKYALFYSCLISFFILMILLSLGVYFQNYFSQWLSLRVTMDLRKMLTRHLLNLDFSYFVKGRTGDILTRVVGDLGSVTDCLNILAVLLTRPFALLACLIYIITINWKLTLWGLIGVPVATIAMKKISRKIRFTSLKSREKNADVSDVMIRFLSGMGTIKAFNCEKFELKNFNHHNEELFKISAKQMRAKCSERPITSLTSKSGIFLVLFIGGNMVLNGELVIENIISFLAALSFMYAPGKDISQANASLQSALPGAQRIFEILETQPTIHEGNKELPEFKDKIVFNNVNFAYNENEPIIKDFSLTIHNGETVALVGSSGAGKSTIINLFLRLYDIDSGSITIDGINIKDLTFASLRDHIALVGQTPFLFNSTVAENISYGREDISIKEIENAARGANIYDEIMDLPEGFQSQVTERGDNFSGGQKQRLSIARAICKNSPILLLDEATSALDSINEKEVQDSLNNLMSGRTSLTVAHRLSTVRHADKIIMMDKGKIIGTGKHHELISTCPAYARLVELQELH